MTMSAPLGSIARATASLTSSGTVDSTMRTPTANPAARAASSMPCKALRCPYKVVFGVRIVTDCTGPPASARAARLGRNPRSSMVARTSSLVDSLTLGWPLITRDTVWYEMARMTRLLAPPDAPAQHQDPAAVALPLLDIVLAGEGRTWSGGRYCESVAGGRFRYAGHHEGSVGSSWRELRVDLADPVTGLRAEVFYRVLAGQGALRSWVRLSHHGREPVTVESVTSFLCGGLAGGTDPASARQPGIPDQLGDLDVRWAETDWLAEGRWQRRPLRDALPDLNRRVHSGDSRGRFELTSLGSWSSGAYLPMGAVTSGRTGHAWAWEIAQNGAWHWQVGECTRRAVDADGPGGRHTPGGSVTGAYIALLGPADAEHHWRITLEPGDAFTTVPVAVVVSGDGFEGVMARLTACRRA